MTSTPADPIAAEAREIAARVLTEHFDAELNRSPADPIGARTRLTDRMAAAFGHRMKAAESTIARHVAALQEIGRGVEADQATIARLTAELAQADAVVDCDNDPRPCEPFESSKHAADSAKWTREAIARHRARHDTEGR